MTGKLRHEKRRISRSFNSKNILYCMAAIDQSVQLRAERPGGRILARVRFSASVQSSPGAHLTSENGYRLSLTGVKRSGSGDNHPLTSSAEVKEREVLYHYSPSGPSWPVLGRISYTLL
jgi:hypothetical protein